MEYDTSQLTAYRNCPKSYYYKYVLGLATIKPMEEEGDRLFGTACHAYLEAKYKGLGLEVCLDKYEEAYPHNIPAIDPAKSYEAGIKLLEAYDEHYKVEDERWEVVEVETRSSFVI